MHFPPVADVLGGLGALDLDLGCLLALELEQPELGDGMRRVKAVVQRAVGAVHALGVEAEAAIAKTGANHQPGRAFGLKAGQIGCYGLD